MRSVPFQFFMRLVEGQRLRGILFRSRVLLCQTEKQGASIPPLAGCTQIEAEFSNTANTVWGWGGLNHYVDVINWDVECRMLSVITAGPWCIADMQQDWTDNEFTQCVEYKILLVCLLVVCLWVCSFLNSPTS